MYLAVLSVNQRVLPGPAAMPSGELLAVGTWYSNTCPLVLMLPMRLAPLSVNQSAPLGPAVMPAGKAFGDGRKNSVIVPLVVIRPILTRPTLPPAGIHILASDRGKRGDSKRPSSNQQE